MNKIDENIKMYFLDLDGTLLDKKSSKGNYEVSELNKDAIAKAQKEGKNIVISTGRMGPFVNNLINELNIDYAVTANGAIVINKKGKILKNDPLTTKQFLLILDIIKDENLCMKLDGELKAYGVNGFFKRKLTKSFGFVDYNHYNCEMHMPHSKIVVWGKSKAQLNKIKKLIIKTVAGLSVESSSHGWTLEITHENSTKGLGNMFVAKTHNLNKSELVHVGDTMNDSTVVKYMKLIALKNAAKNLKNIATHLGPNWKKGGVAKVLNGEFKKNINKK